MGCLDSRKYVVGVIVCSDSLLKCHVLSFNAIVGQLCKFHTIKNERLVSSVAVKTIVSRRLQADPAPPPRYFTTDLRQFIPLKTNTADPFSAPDNSEVLDQAGCCNERVNGVFLGV